MNEINQLFSELTYEEKCKFYNEHFSSCATTTTKLKDKLILIGLICFVVNKMREKDGSVTVKSVLEKIIHKPLMDMNVFEEYLNGLCIVCEDMLYGCKEFDSFGLTSSQEILDRIRGILNEWMPF